jgi:hypothetical protein
MNRTLTRQLMSARWAGRTSAAMAWRPRAVVLAVALAVASTIACGPGGDTRRPFVITGPTPQVETPGPAPTPPPGPPIRVTVTNGWTKAAVPGARVTIGADIVVTDQLGQFEVPTPVPCVPATVAADGFLERRVKCLTVTTVRGSAPVTLWPVESDEERLALKTLAFDSGALVKRGFQQLDIARTVDDRAVAIAAWQRADRILRDATAGHLTTTVPTNVEALQDGTIVDLWSAPADCTHSGTIAWFAVSGFCMGTYRGPAYPYFIELVRVAPSKVTSEAVALRALMYGFGLRPHAVPGLLNSTRPDDTLSLFERRMLHMITLRERPSPGGTAWPDTEF